MNLRSLDLNLLPVFEAVYVERSLTRASEVLHITQPAVSNALTRMRGHFGDPLFVRSGRGVAPTSAADALIGPVRDALNRLRSGLEKTDTFDASTSARVFSIAVRDLGAFTLAPILARRFEREAPGIRLHWRQADRAEIALDLAAGRLDFAIDIPALRRSGLDDAPLLSDRYVCVFRRGHPMADARLDLDAYLSLRHISVSSRAGGRSIVEEALRSMGHRLDLAVRLPHYLPAFQVVMTSDGVLAAPSNMAGAYDVIARDLPFDVPELALNLYWRREAGENPGLRWMRDQILAAADPKA